MKKIKFILTKEQRKHLKSIQWLLSENDRQSGRSMLLAYAYIYEALKGKRVEIIDHAFISGEAGYRANKILANYIVGIIKENELPLEIKWTTLTLIPL